jgi:hypothetical protein
MLLVARMIFPEDGLMRAGGKEAVLR